MNYDWETRLKIRAEETDKYLSMSDEERLAHDRQREEERKVKIEMSKVPDGYNWQFPVPFSFDDFKEDIVRIYVMVLWQSRFLMDGDDQKFMDFLFNNKERKDLINPVYPEGDFHNPDFTYDDIKDSILVSCLEQMYRYAYEGIDTQWYEYHTESDLTWVAYMLMDMTKSRTTNEWAAYGFESFNSASRCYQVAELANARCKLEGHEEFFYFEDHDFDGFTIRQMALLSGMEEMSVRAAANPKRANPLKTSKSIEGNTFVDQEEAKRWLISKKRYIPVKVVHSFHKEIRIEEAAVNSSWTFRYLIESILSQKLYKGDLSEEVMSKIKDLGVEADENNQITSFGDILESDEKVSDLAVLLGINPDITVLRYKEGKMRDEIMLIEAKLETARSNLVKK